MASSRQRSFFDQKPTNTRTWNSRKPPYKEPPPNLPPPRPPIAPSAKSKSKLASFRYIAAQDTYSLPMGDFGLDAANKENVESVHQYKAGSQGGEKALRSSLKQSPDRCSFPQTPVARVPFADLVYNVEEALDRSPIPTPNEGVAWKQSPSSSETQSFKAPRGMKRARSSSPISSSQPSTSAHVNNLIRPSFDLQSFQDSLNVQQVDPAVDLEKRYFSAALYNTPSKPRASAVAELVHSSSPQTPAVSANNSAKLRRTMSCGVAFPRSNGKRRKVSCLELANVEDNAVNGLAVSGTVPRLSKISILLDKINNGLSYQPTMRTEATVNNGLSSSSPFPLQTKAESQTTNARSQPLTTKLNKSTSLSNLHHNYSRQAEPPRLFQTDQIQDPAIHRQEAETRACYEGSSDFGGDDIESTLLDVVNANLVTGSNLNLDNANRPLTSPETSGNHLGNHPIEAQAPHTIDTRYAFLHNERRTDAAIEKDEFDDDDEGMDDLLAADYELVASMYDRQPDRNNGSTEENRGQPVAEDHGTSSRDQPRPKLPTVDEAHLQKTDYVELSSDEEFGCEDFEDIAEEFKELTQAAERRATSIDTKPPLVQRYTVKAIHDDEYVTEKGFSRSEKLLQVQEWNTQSFKLVALRDSWLSSPCTVGAHVHVLGEFDSQGRCTVDNERNLLILHPDHLLSATVVADSFNCTRRAVLQDRVKATNEAGEAQVYGHILHEVFQEALRANRWDRAWLSDLARATASRYMETLFELNIDVERAIGDLMRKMANLQPWAELFVSAKPKPGAYIKGTAESGEGGVPLSITKLLDVEEHVWSPKFGLKGNIDATIQVKVRDGNDEKTLVVPFEVKTGRATNNISHNSQTALYTLLLSDRYDVQIAFGILYYMETSGMSQIFGNRRDILHMIMKRNELACFVRRRQELPPMLKNDFTCGKCYAQTSCFVYHKLKESGDGKTSGMGPKFDQLVGHLKPVHADFFKLWDDLLTKEESDVLKFRKELWTMLSSEREKVGRCFGGLVISPGCSVERTQAAKINRFEYVLSKQNAPSSFTFTESQINTGEPIVISDEAGHYALANGYVTKIRRHEISVAVDRRLHNARVKGRAFDKVNNQDFAGIMEVLGSGQVANQSNSDDPSEQTLYRLDKDEFSNGMATVRNNLIRIMEKDLFRARALRELVIEGVPPKFNNSLETHNELTAAESELNVDQQKAVMKVMSAQDYALVLGMPGTGKTTTIAHIIRALVAKGKSVLLTSYTHTAVDNILLKIRDDKLSILRIGAESKIHPSVKEFSDLACNPKTSFEEIKKSYGSQVVATTCLGINHPIFNQRTFDYCIVDEASQITLPVCLGPIRMAHKFVLVGDHYQLPPLVQNKEAQEGGLDISLFKLLSEKQPHSVTNLTQQYRMCEDIMSLSNTLIYKGLLKCGSPDVATRALVANNIQALKHHHHTPLNIGPTLRDFCPGPTLGNCWLRDAVDPSRRVIFLNTDLLKETARETAIGSRITNPLEVTVTTQIVKALLTIGVSPAELGVITLYRSQLSLLRSSFRQHAGSCVTGTEPISAIEMHTADKYQGRDKDAIVLSLVRSNDKNNVGDLLQDWRRVNVALTRARTKMVIVGSFETIRRGSDLLGKLCKMIDDRNWRLDLKPDAVDQHWFDDWTSQLSGLGRQLDTKAEKIAKTPDGSKHLGNRSPEKVGKRMNPERILGSRHVLRDIVNEASG